MPGTIIDSIIGGIIGSVRGDVGARYGLEKLAEAAFSVDENLKANIRRCFEITSTRTSSHHCIKTIGIIEWKSSPLSVKQSIIKISIIQSFISNQQML